MKKRYSSYIDGHEVAFLESYLNLELDSDLLSYYFKIEQGLDENSFNYIKKQIKSNYISILVYIETNPNFRQQKVGTNLIQEFINESSGDIILICDIEQDFIIKWYESYGFDLIKNSNRIHPLPIMIRTN